MRYLKSILSYWDRALYLIVFVYALKHQMEAVAITFALLTIIGGQRIRDFVLAIFSKLEQSDEGGAGPFSWKKPRDPVPLPKSDLKKIDIDVETGIIPEDFYKLFQAGISSLQRGDIQKTKEMFENAEELDPNNFEVYTQLGYVYDLTHEYQKSIDHSKRALEIKPDSFTPQFNLAVATNHLYGAVKSLSEYLKAEDIARNAGNIDDKITIGKLNLFLGHDYRDIRNYEEALERYNSAKTIFTLCDTPEAQTWLKDANDNIARIEILSD